MRNKQVTPLASFPERRRFGRITVAEPRICHIHLPQSQELWTEQGILMNISLGGIYLVCDKQPPLEKNDIRYLSLDTSYADPGNHHLGFQILVVRTEQRKQEPHQFAVALRIISTPTYYALQGTNQRDFTSSDKARIMYQYYDLNKKAHEIITKAPDIRTDRIKDFKEYIEKGSYNLQSEKVTQRMIDDLFMEQMLLFKT
ncbi:MAG: flagellar biosynthesis anti-sigma factor FlgM [Desulfobaccales bacterium]